MTTISGPMLGRRSFLRATGGALALAVGGGALAACAGNKAVASDSSGNRKIRIASPFISTMNSAVLYAQGTGIFAKHNIEASFIQVDGGGSLASTLGGSTDMAIASSVIPFAALSQGQKFPIIAQIGNGFPESVFIAKSDWDKSGLKQDSPLEDKMAFLAGKPWGVSSPQGSSSYMAKYLFQLAGLKATDFKLNSMGSVPAILAAVKAGKVVAGSGGSPYPQIAEEDGYAKMYIDVAGGEVTEVSNTLTSVVAVTPDFYAKNSALVADFRTALGEAQALVYSDSAAVDDYMFKTYFKESPKAAVLAGVGRQRAGLAIAKTPEVSSEAATRLVTFMKATGQAVPDNWRDIIPDLAGGSSTPTSK